MYLRKRSHIDPSQFLGHWHKKLQRKLQQLLYLFTMAANKNGSDLKLLKSFIVYYDEEIRVYCFLSYRYITKGLIN